MKVPIIIFFFLSFLNKVSAQDTVRNKIDTLNNNYTRNTLSNSKYYNPQTKRYIIDGKLIEDSLSVNVLKELNPKDILKIDVLKYSPKENVYINRPGSDFVIITTRNNAKKQYQKRLSGFSKEYKNYLEQHKNDDENVIYILNGVQLQGKRDDIISKLFNISGEKIKTVNFMDKYFKDFLNNSKPVVVIVTKK